MGKIWPSAGTGKREKKKPHCQALPCNAECFSPAALDLRLLTSSTLDSGLYWWPAWLLHWEPFVSPSSLQTAPASWQTSQQINLYVCALCSFVPMCICVCSSVSQQTPSPVSIELLHLFVESYLRSLTWWYRHVLNSHFQDAEATERHCEFQSTLSDKKTKK